ncbi:MAG: hypothetical protein ACOY90_05345 [Candidatus Zhuqueibacterota bacterium]
MRNAVVGIVILMLTGFGSASEPQVKMYQKQKDLAEGSPEGISITWQGDLTLAPEFELIANIERPFVWDVTADRTGNLFLATGDGAKIYRINAEGKLDVIARWDENEVYSLAVDKNNVPYAAVSPGAAIYRIRANQPELYASLGAKYIWDMVFDVDNTCYAATGDSGLIYKISPAGKPSVFYRSNEVHFRCLAWDNRGRLLAGSFSDGYIYRIEKTGEAFVLYDSEFQEIHHVAVATDGAIYAAGLGRDGVPMPLVTREAQPQPMVSRDKEMTDVEDTMRPEMPRSIKMSGIIKISPDGSIKDIWQKDTDLVQSIVLQPDQSLLVGTSDKGRIYRISGDEERTLLIQLEGAQISDFQSTPAGVWAVTSNLGKVYRILPRMATKGAFVSPVFDAKVTAHWGSLRWQSEVKSGYRVTFHTRSGNTEKPNDTWSAWSAASIRNEAAEITSPAARFLQWKMELVSEQNSIRLVLSDIEVTYLQENLPPEISEIALTSPGDESDDSEKEALPGAKAMTLAAPLSKSKSKPVSDGRRAVRWMADDGNDDELLFHLFFQLKGDQHWRMLKKSVSQKWHEWDSRLLPDGEFRIKIIASDEKENPVNLYKTDEMISDWFMNDNSGPSIGKLLVKQATRDSLQISFQVSDTYSAIKEVAFSTNVEQWQLVYPVDFICDSKTEYFDFKIAAPADGAFSVVVKATDTNHNIGFNRSMIKE